MIRLKENRSVLSSRCVAAFGEFLAKIALKNYAKGWSEGYDEAKVEMKKKKRKKS